MNFDKVMYDLAYIYGETDRQTATETETQTQTQTQTETETEIEREYTCISRM